jgi:hypothetical protein
MHACALVWPEERQPEESHESEKQSSMKRERDQCFRTQSGTETETPPDQQTEKMGIWGLL